MLRLALASSTTRVFKDAIQIIVKLGEFCIKAYVLKDATACYICRMTIKTTDALFRSSTRFALQAIKRTTLTYELRYQNVRSFV